MDDRSHGYERLAETFIRARNEWIGPDVVRAWAEECAPGSEVLELGCGHGAMSQVLVDAGLKLWAIDASPTLLAAFRERFPGVETECAAAEESNFFGRTFDGVVAVGLLFLLEEEAQKVVLRKAARALRTGGQLLFTAPLQVVEWRDIMTGERSRSLGVAVYEQVLREEGLEISWGVTDEGENHYFSGIRP
jgi:SAM-dependent methyltransferase